MKRIANGIAILAVLLVIAVLFTLLMDDIHTPLAQNLQAAAQAAAEENWQKAAALFRQASLCWEENKHFVASLADHSPMDEMDGLFAELEVYLQQQEMPHFAATCRHLAKLAEAMGENHALNWWNLL